MAGEIAETAPEFWRADWYHAAAFLADPAIPLPLHDWLQNGVDPQLRSYVWWAAATDKDGFAMMYHQSAAQLGFWLSPELRGRGWGKSALRRGLRHLPADENPLVLADVARDNPAALRTARGAGMRIMAEQLNRTVFCLYRSPML